MADALSRYQRHKKKWKQLIPLYLQSPKLTRNNPLDKYSPSVRRLPKTYSHAELQTNISPTNLIRRKKVILPSLDGVDLYRGRMPSRTKSVNRRINQIFLLADSELKRNPSQPVIDKSRSQSTKAYDKLLKISSEKDMYNTQEVKRIIQSRERQKSKYTERLAEKKHKKALLTRIRLNKKAVNY